MRRCEQNSPNYRVDIDPVFVPYLTDITWYVAVTSRELLRRYFCVCKSCVPESLQFCPLTSHPTTCLLFDEAPQKSSRYVSLCGTHLLAVLNVTGPNSGAPHCSLPYRCGNCIAHWSYAGKTAAPQPAFFTLRPGRRLIKLTGHVIRCQSEKRLLLKTTAACRVPGSSAERSISGRSHPDRNRDGVSCRNTWSKFSAGYITVKLQWWLLSWSTGDDWMEMLGQSGKSWSEACCARV